MSDVFRNIIYNISILMIQDIRIFAQITPRPRLTAAGGQDWAEQGREQPSCGGQGLCQLCHTEDRGIPPP